VVQGFPSPIKEEGFLSGLPHEVPSPLAGEGQGEGERDVWIAIWIHKKGGKIMGSVVKKRRKKMRKHKHKKQLDRDRHKKKK
jgi:hypothetical protein